MTDNQDIPPSLEESDELGPESSQELGIVVLGGSDQIRPKARLLPGRFPPSFFTIPAMIAIIIAGIIAVIFAIQTEEWSPWTIASTWFVLYVWTWFYGVAYKYRRFILRWLSMGAFIFLSCGISFFCIDRAAPQYIVGPDGLVMRELVFSLWISAILTLGAAAILLSHFVFFGRGYREKSV